MASYTKKKKKFSDNHCCKKYDYIAQTLVCKMEADTVHAPYKK